MKSTTPLVCNLGVFIPAQREAHLQTTMQLMRSIRSVREVENGYEFRLPNETELIVRIAEFVANERLCCPFLEFTLHVVANREPVSLALTGPIDTQEFLRAEFNGAIP